MTGYPCPAFCSGDPVHLLYPPKRKLSQLFTSGAWGTDSQFLAGAGCQYPGLAVQSIGGAFLGGMIFLFSTIFSFHPGKLLPLGFNDGSTSYIGQSKGRPALI
jgi:hypothetical protein